MYVETNKVMENVIFNTFRLRNSEDSDTSIIKLILDLANDISMNFKLT